MNNPIISSDEKESISQLRKWELWLFFIIVATGRGVFSRSFIFICLGAFMTPFGYWKSYMHSNLTLFTLCLVIHVIVYEILSHTTPERKEGAAICDEYKMFIFSVIRNRKTNQQE